MLVALAANLRTSLPDIGLTQIAIELIRRPLWIALPSS
jgi:hypothetical protein